MQATDENEDQSWIKIKHGMNICNKKICHNQTSHSSSTGNPPKESTNVVAKLDSGASGNYFRWQDAAVCFDDLSDNDGPEAITPTLDIIKATKKGTIPVQSKKLGQAAKTAHVFKNLNSASLVSVAAMCDDGCEVVFDKHNAFIIKDNELVLQGYRNWNDKLWDIRLPKGNKKEQDPQQKTPDGINNKMCVILRKDQSKLTLAKYHHHTLFGPTEATLRTAIRNKHLITWPGLTQELLTKGLPQSEATAKGHMKQQRQNLQSTKTLLQQAISTSMSSEQVKVEDEEKDYFPEPDTPNVKSHAVVYALVDPRKVGTASMDLTGKFPYTSRRGNRYILVGYHYDANYVAAIAIKKRTAGEITKGWERLHKKFAIAGSAPSAYVMDNETSKELLDALTKKEIKYQLAPPYMHRTNAAERAIQSFKSHFITGLVLCHSKFPIEEWDQLLDQAEITLNLLRSARNNPSLSAYAYLRGQYDYNATPMAPPGTKVVVHEKPSTRTSWGNRGVDGWYVGPSLHHYRCVRCFIPTTKAVRDADTVLFIPETIPYPEVSIEDHLKQATTDIIRILTNPPSTSTIPSLEIGDKTKNALLKIADILNTNTTLPALPAQTSTSHIQQSSAPPTYSPTAQPISAPTATPTSSTNNTAVPRVLNPTSVSKKSVSLPRVKEPSKMRDLNKNVLQEIQRTIKTLQKKYPPPTRRSNRLKRPSTKYTNGYSTAATRLLAQHIYEKYEASSTHVHHIYDDNGKKMNVHDLMTNPATSTIWTKAMSMEMGRLAKGNKYGVKYTDTIEFIRQQAVPSGRDVTYGNFICDHRPLKSEPWRIRLTVGGDKLSYDDDPGSPAASLLETKIMLNSVISDAHKGARFMGLDLKDFFLATPMTRCEYMKIHYKHFPDDIKEQYGIDELKTDNDYVYVKIKKGMYGLKQAAILAYENLMNNLRQYGYRPVPHALGIWTHESRPICFCLCVDDFGIKYFNKDDAQHLLSSLQNHYTVTTDWHGRNFCGLTINWNYDKQYVDISMPKYINHLLTKLNYTPQKHPQYSPHHYDPIIYGKKSIQQMATAQHQHDPLPKEKIKYVQSVVGSLLYYARAIESTILPALNDISKSQANPSEVTLQQCQRVLDYVNTYKKVRVRYYASDMILNVETDAAYLVLPKARSRLAGYFHMGYHRNHPKYSKSLNGAVLVECKTIAHVVSSAAEAETAGLFHNAQMSIPIRHILIALGHPQPPTPIKTDNSTAVGFTYDNINQKRSKSWDMRYYWLRDRQTQRQFDIHWDKGELNNADYYTKHHSEKHHKEMRHLYVIDEIQNVINNLNPSIQATNQPTVVPSGARVCWNRSRTPEDRTRDLCTRACTNGQSVTVGWRNRQSTTN